MASAREVALETLLVIESEGSYSNLALASALRHNTLSSQDRQLVTTLVYGTVQHLRLLDHLLQPFLKQKVKSLKPWVRQLLRMSVYQLFFLERVPSFAVVNESVQLTGKRAQSLKGFVNAVLRNVLRSEAYQKRDVYVRAEHVDTTLQLAILTSHPDWMVEDWALQYGFEQAKAICIANNDPPFLSVRVNPLRMKREEWLERVRAEGIAAEESEVSPVGVRILQGLDIAGWHWFQEGVITVQDESAMLVAPVLEPNPGERILDACAAPGGKTTHLAELMQDHGEIWAADLHAHKIELINGAARRLGLQSIRTQTRDMSRFELEETGVYDRILLDAPCSGLGVIRRKPDLKWKKDKKEIRSLPRIQLDLLESCWKRLRSGGVLVYSTCTTLSAENSSVVERFYKRHSDVRLDQVTSYLPEKVAERVHADPFGVTILPTDFGSDGFFISRLSKM